MSTTVKKITLKTPAVAGAMGQFSALERCRGYASGASDSAAQALSASTAAQAAASVAVAAKTNALAAVGAVKTTQNDTDPSVLDQALSVSAPLFKAVVNPGADESISLSVGTFAGAGPSLPGTSGVVPAPQAGDQLKFLRADATWQSPTDVWLKLAGTVAVLTDTQVSLSGNLLDTVLPDGSGGRAIRPDKLSGAYGHVASATYDSQADKTIITVEGFTLASDCTELWIGQDPRNAPSSSSAGSDMYLVEKYNTFTY